MLARLPAALVALALSACTSHEGPVSTGREPEQPPEAVKVPHASLTIAIASVTLQQDCPDPPEPPPPTPAALAPAAPAEPGPAARALPMKNESMAQPHPGASVDGRGGWQQPCTQSSMQLALTNTGDAPGVVFIKSVRLLDAASKQPLGSLNARRPTLWDANSLAGSYQKWDQRILPGATLKTSYSLGDPSWTEVTQKLGGSANEYTTPFILEVDIVVDGAVQTVRSPEFMRQEVHLIVT